MPYRHFVFTFFVSGINLPAKKIVKGGKTTSYVGKNFTKGRKYYVKVRAHKNVNGQKVYGKWSNVKSVKCK